MNIIDRITINRFHDDRAKEFGVGTVEALGWHDNENQRIRFEVLSKIANLDDLTLMDAGCGHGDLCPFLLAKYPAINYVGIDNNAALLDIALERYGNDKQAKFLLGDFTGPDLPTADYVLCSGGLSYRNQDADFIKNIIEKLFNASRYGFGFNLLSKVKNPDGILVAYTPEEILNICRKLTSHVQLHADYLEEDFSVFLYQDSGKGTGKEHMV